MHCNYRVPNMITRSTASSRRQSPFRYNGRRQDLGMRLFYCRFHHPANHVLPSTDMYQRPRATYSTLLLHLNRATKLDPEATFAQLSPSNLCLLHHRYPTPRIPFVGSQYTLRRRMEWPATQYVLITQHLQA